MAERDEGAPTGSSFSEIGASGLPFAERYLNLWKVRALRSGPSTRQLMTMRRFDGQARSLFLLLTQPIMSALRESSIVRPERGGRREAEFVRQALELPASEGGMVVPMRKVVAQILLALNDGFSPFELVAYVPKTGKLKGKATFRKIAYRPADTITFLTDDRDEFAGLNQITQRHGEMIDVMIPESKSFYFAAQEQEQPLYGRSYMEAAFKHFDKKEKLYYLLHLAAQRAAVGTRIGTHPRAATKADKAAFARMMDDLRAAGWGTMPENYKVEALREVGGWDFLAAINHHNSMMSKSIIANFNDDQQGTGGDASLVDFGKEDDKMFLIMIRSILEDVAEVINNEIIVPLVDWNFSSGKYPKFTFGDVTDDQRALIYDVYKKLAIAGQAYIGTPEMVREVEKRIADRLGFDIDYDEIAKRDEEEAELEKAQQAAAMGMMPGGTPSSAPAGLPVPDGFQLSNTIGLARYIKTQQGATYFKKPIGSIVNDNGEDAATPQAAPQPAPAGSPTPDRMAEELPEPKAEYGHPDFEGVKLLDFGDGTFAVKYQDGTASPRQSASADSFKSLGWDISTPDGDDLETQEKVRRAQKGTRARQKADPGESDD